jgi:hypothetical protein
MSAGDATTENKVPNPNYDLTPKPLYGPATPRQIAGLKRFNAQIPPTLSKQQASDWMDLLISKAGSGAKITSEDLSGPPSFQKASELPKEGTEKAAPAALPSAAPATPPSPPKAPAASPEACPERFPTAGQDWITVELETTVQVGDEFNRTLIKIAAHPVQGETFEQLRDRLLVLVWQGQ